MNKKKIARQIVTCKLAHAVELTNLAGQCKLAVIDFRGLPIPYK